MKYILLLFIFFAVTFNSFADYYYYLEPKVFYSLNSIDYQSKWKDAISFTGQNSYGFGLSAGRFFQNKKPINLAFSVGLEFSNLNLSADVNSAMKLDNHHILNKNFTESYHIISIPIKGAVYFTKLSETIMPSVELSIIPNFPGIMKPSGQAEKTDGSTYDYDIEVKSYFSYALGISGTMKVSNMNLGITLSYYGALQPLYENADANLSLSGIVITAKMKFDL
jgi:hypothetical protein